jgi:putative DNA primase/helicase
MIDVVYDPTATCPQWDTVYSRVQPAAPVRPFLRRATGYSATGSARERQVIILFGGGKNGKGVFLQTLRQLLGDYAIRCPSTTFLARRDDAIPNDVAQLRGARFVFASETNENRRLAEATIKDLTGGEDISARFMRAEWFSFTPTFTPWLATNHRPIIKGQDEAIWDRLALAPWSVRIPDAEQNRALVDELRVEYAGILAWIVRGAKDWYEHGLGTPAAVASATADYRSEMDVLGGFIEEHCVIDPQAWVTTGALYKRYMEWCEASGERSLSQTALGLRLLDRGFHAGRQGKDRTRSWRGLRLRLPTEEATADGFDEADGYGRRFDHERQ